VLPFSFDMAIFGRIVENSFLTKREYKRLIISGIFSLNERFEGLEKYIFVDIHKKSRYIEFQNICVFLVVIGCGSYERFDAFYAKKRSLPDSTTIGIMDKSFFENWVQFMYQKMMNDPISKISGKYLSFDGMMNNKCYTLANFVPTRDNIVV